MKLKRHAELTFYSLFSILTGHRYYICEDCHRVHKKDDSAMEICGGWYEHHVFVSEECAQRTIRKAWKLLLEGKGTDEHDFADSGI